MVIVELFGEKSTAFVMIFINARSSSYSYPFIYKSSSISILQIILIFFIFPRASPCFFREFINF